MTMVPTDRRGVPLCEILAYSVHLAHQLGTALPIAQDDVDRLYDRYQNAYGQR